MCNFPFGEFTEASGEGEPVVPKRAEGGSSFAGAGKYYLHDKRPEPGSDIAAGVPSASRDFEAMGAYALHDKGGLRSSDRVGFTQNLNMAADGPQEAIQQMTASYDAFREREKGKRGRKLTQPLYPYSLSWAPDETPSQAEMMKAALSSLKALGLENLQTLIVQHTDEPHPHIHILVNRIELDGSRARNIPYDKLKLSRWAEQWEKDHGGVRCEERVKNNALRQQGQIIKDEKSRPYSDYKAERLARQEAYREQRRAREAAYQAAKAEREARREQWKAERAAQRAEFKLWRATQDDQTKQRHRSLRATMARRQTEEVHARERGASARIEEHRTRLNDRYKPAWADLYRQQNAEKRALPRMGMADRLTFVVTNRHRLFPKGMTLKGGLALVASGKKLANAVEREHERTRARLGSQQRDDFSLLCKKEWNEHYLMLNVVTKPRHQLERDQLRALFAEEWQLVRRRREGFRDETRFLAERNAGHARPTPTPAKGEPSRPPVLREMFEAQSPPPSAREPAPVIRAQVDKSTRQPVAKVAAPPTIQQPPAVQQAFETAAVPPMPARPTMTTGQPAGIEEARKLLEDQPAAEPRAPAPPRPGRKTAEQVEASAREYAERLRREGKSPDFGREL
ncbi:relaxase/mobilization nuclease domain-containing protein (plasmid) [Segnochrobactraceae bacterium EtOH-i3]